MKPTYKFWLILILFLFTSIFAPIFSQSSSKKLRLLVMEDIVLPSKMMEYEKAQKDMNEFLKKNNFNITWNAYQTDDFNYMYVVPFYNLNQVDSLFNLWNSKVKAVGNDEFSKVLNQFNGTIDYNNSLIVELVDSYKAQNPYFKADEAKFIHWDFFEIIPGKEKESKKLLEEYKKINEKLKIPVSYNLWNVVFGEHSTTMIFTTQAKDDVDFYTHNKQSDELLMKEPGGADLYMKFLSGVRKFHHINGKPRPDLSLK